MRRFHGALCVASVCVFGIACNALTGIGDLSEGVTNDAGFDAGTDARVIPPSDTGTGMSAPDADVPDTSTVDSGPPPECPSAGHSCVPVPPDGWDGPFIGYEGARGNVPGCPTEAPQTDDENINAPQGSIMCADCRCGGSKNINCGATLDAFNEPATCATSIVTGVDITTCQTNNTGSDNGIKSQFTAANGSCDPFVMTKNKSGVVWPDVFRLCGRKPGEEFLQNGCSADELCVPDGAQPFKQHTCIANDDDVACPAPWTQKQTTFTDVNDSRDCSANSCSCKGPEGIACGGIIHQYTSSDCSGAFTNVTPNTCSVSPIGASQKAVGLKVTNGGSCKPLGNPTPIGGVSAGGSHGTICCVP